MSDVPYIYIDAYYILNRMSDMIYIGQGIRLMEVWARRLDYFDK